jgi:Bax protein
VLIALAVPLFVACSDGHDYESEILLNLPDLSCQGMAKASSLHWKSTTPGRRSVAQSQLLTLEDSDAVLRHFQEIGYDYEGVANDAQPVPRVYLAKMPSDLSDMDDLATRKRLFLAAMLPAILQVNEEIRETRRRLVAIDACEQAGYPPSEAVQNWVARVADHYRTDSQAAPLLEKIGEIPPSLALAQAAVESGWGTSNPAQSFNSLFGQYTAPDDDDAADAGAKKPVWRLASYDNILEAVRAYADNLNTHRAYSAFRARRLTMIQKGEPLSGLKLAEKLGSYSTRKIHYVQDVQRMIRRNSLAALDQADFDRPAGSAEVAMNTAN